MSADWHCKVGRVRPKLALYNNPKVYEADWQNDVGFVEDLIQTVRDSGTALGYTIVVTHEDGSVTRATKNRRSGSDFQMLGAVAYELVDIVSRINRGQSQ